MAAIPDADEVRRIFREELERALRATVRPIQREALSKRAAAKMLGVDRGRGLADLVSAGHLREVEIRGRTCIRREDVERVLSVGAPAPATPGRRHVGGASGAAHLRALKLEGT
jgi:hypothetical protein